MVGRSPSASSRRQSHTPKSHLPACFTSEHLRTGEGSFRTGFCLLNEGLLRFQSDRVRSGKLSREVRKVSRSQVDRGRAGA